MHFSHQRKIELSLQSVLSSRNASQTVHLYASVLFVLTYFTFRLCEMIKRSITWSELLWGKQPLSYLNSHPVFCSVSFWEHEQSEYDYVFIIRNFVTQGCMIKYPMITTDSIRSDNLLIQIIYRGEIFCVINLFHYLLSSFLFCFQF